MSSSSSNDDTSYSVFKQDGSHQFYCRWSLEEDMLLTKAVAEHGPHKWTSVSRSIPGRTAVQCSTRWFGALNPNVHKGRWSKHEDKALSEAVKYYQQITKDPALPWNRIAENIPHRTGIQCQARWTEALDPAVRKGRWLLSEDELLGKAIQQYGCCWIRVAGMIPTRTQRQCRTRWNQIHSQQLKIASAAKTAAENTTEQQQQQMNPPTTSIAPLDFDFYSPFSLDEDDFLAQYSSSISRSSSLSSYSGDAAIVPQLPDMFIDPTTSFAGMQDLLDLQGFLYTSSNNNLFQTKQIMDELLTVQDFEFLLDL